MRGLERIPQAEDLAAAYVALQSARPCGAAELALWTQWSRFDPRLAEQLVARIAASWKDLHPFELRARLLEQPWPAAFGVLVRHAADGALVERGERALFARWGDGVMEGIAPASGEQFFIGTSKFAGKRMRLDAERPLRAYLRWGYLGRELLVNKERGALERIDRTLIPAPVRRRVLAELLVSRSSLRVRDYREALGNRISRRQAELDLAREERLLPVGRTRARIYRVVRRVRRRRAGRASNGPGGS